MARRQIGAFLLQQLQESPRAIAEAWVCPAWSGRGIVTLALLQSHSKVEENGMGTKLQSKRFGLGKIVLAGSALAGFLFFTGAPRFRADGDCQRRIAKADHRLHEAIEHHGRDYRQADHASRDLHQAREDCWKRNHRWWDENP